MSKCVFACMRSPNSCINLVFATELTGTKGLPFYVHRRVFLLPFRYHLQAPRVGVTLFTYTDVFYTSFPVSLTGTKGRCYPFYVHVYRPVLFSVLHCISTGTKGKNYPFTFTDLCV